MGAIYLMDPNQEKLELIVAYPPDFFAELKQSHAQIDVVDPYVVARAVQRMRRSLWKMWRNIATLLTSQTG
ncbi:MAG: hypothetical protein R2856_12990 [Caldilineaceae bacterium]